MDPRTLIKNPQAHPSLASLYPTVSGSYLLFQSGYSSLPRSQPTETIAFNHDSDTELEGSASIHTKHETKQPDPLLNKRQPERSGAERDEKSTTDNPFSSQSEAISAQALENSFQALNPDQAKIVEKRRHSGRCGLSSHVSRKRHTQQQDEQIVKPEATKDTKQSQAAATHHSGSDSEPEVTQQSTQTTPSQSSTQARHGQSTEQCETEDTSCQSSPIHPPSITQTQSTRQSRFCSTFTSTMEPTLFQLQERLAQMTFDKEQLQAEVIRLTHELETVV